MVSLVRFFLHPKVSTNRGHIDRISARLAGSGNRTEQPLAAVKFSLLCLLTSSLVPSLLLAGISVDVEPVEEGHYDLGVELRTGATA